MAAAVAVVVMRSMAVAVMGWMAVVVVVTVPQTAARVVVRWW